MGIVKYLLGWPLSLISLLFVFKIIQPKLPTLIPKLSEINLHLLFYGVICFFIYFLLRGVLWGQILKLKGYKLSFKKTLFFWNTSELKRYTPGNIWSFLGRTVSFSNLGIKNKDIFSSLLFESELIVAGTVIVSLMSLGFIFRILPDSPLEPIIQPLIVILVVILSLLFIFNPFNLPLLPKFKYQDNLKLLVISSLIFFIWGIGNYLVASSLFLLTLQNFLEFVGFFVFALLVGYLSIITPMGLGVREGILTLGLSKILTLEVAGFISIFVRVVFVISELIFLFLSWGWKNTKNKFVLKIESLVVNHKHETILLLLIFAYFLYFTTASFARFDNFYTGRFDLGNMDQTVWNTINGRIFQLTDPNGTEIISRLGFHADFILILISPLYLIWSHPKMLLLAQTLILSLGAIFVFLISKEILKRKDISFVFSITYLLNPSVEFSNLYDFHAITFATTFLLASFYFLIKKRYAILIIFLILSGLTKEDVWIIVSLIGGFIFLFYKRRILGLSIFILSLLTFYFLVWHAIPANGIGKHFALSYYSDFGDSPEKILKNVVFNPAITLTKIVQQERITYLNQLFLPLGFLPLYSIFVIFSFPTLFINLLSSNSQLHKIFYQYTATITPFLLISAIFAIKNLRNILPTVPNYFYFFLLLAAAIYGSFNFGPMPWGNRASIAMFTKPLENKEIIDKILSKIPKGYSVSSTNDLGSHLSQREKIYTVPITNNADIVAFLIRKDTFSISRSEELQTLEKIKDDKNYLEIFKDGDFFVFQRKDLPLILSFHKYLQSNH